MRSLHLVNWRPKPKPAPPPPPPPPKRTGEKDGKGEKKPKGGIVVSDETLRKLIEKKGRIFPGPKEPVKSA